MVGDRGQGVPLGCLVRASEAPSKNVSWGPRTSQRGPVQDRGHGPEWSERPSISISLRAAVSKVVQLLFIHGFLIKLFIYIWMADVCEKWPILFR